MSLSVVLVSRHYLISLMTHLYSFLANYDSIKKEWVRVGPEPYVLELPVWRQYPRPCQNLVNGGQADPRFIWSDAGEPLAILGTASRVPGVCKSVGMVDLRAVWPALKHHLDSIGYRDIPIKFRNFTEVGKTSKKEAYEKNWAPFFSGSKPAGKSKTLLQSLSSLWRQNLAESKWPYFASQIVPRSILKVDTALDTSERSADLYVLSREMDLSMHVAKSPPRATSDCILQYSPQDWDPRRFHQATPFHRVTMCSRHNCVPTRENTVLLGLIHYKKAAKQYRR